jgi:hypothetical protein
MPDNLARIPVDWQDLPSTIGKSGPPNSVERVVRFPSSIPTAGAGGIKAAIELVNEAVAEMRRIEKRALETQQYAQAVAGKAVESLRIADQRVQQLEAERNTWEEYINQAIVMTREAARILTAERARFGDAEDKMRQFEARFEAFEVVSNDGANAIIRLKDEILAHFSRRDAERDTELKELPAAE